MLSLFLASVLAVASGAASAKGIALTVIPRAPTGGCYVTLDPSGRKIVGYLWDDGWRWGINSKLYTFLQRDSSYDNLTGAYTAHTRDRTITIRTVGAGSNANADNIEVTVKNSKRLFRGYKFCAPGD
jgi:hypothetical protein